MKKKPILPHPVPQKALKAVMEMRRDCTHVVTEQQLNLDEFGKALRQLREDSEISLRDMAKRINLSPPFLSDCELGNRRLSLAHHILFVIECKP